MPGPTQLSRVLAGHVARGVPALAQKDPIDFETLWLKGSLRFSGIPRVVYRLYAISVLKGFNISQLDIGLKRRWVASALLLIPLEVPCRRVLETARAIHARDRERGIPTDDPVVERLAKASPKNSAAFSCLDKLSVNAEVFILGVCWASQRVFGVNRAM